MAVGGGPLVGMVIVVPALAVREQRHELVVAAVVSDLVVAIAPDVGRRIKNSRSMALRQRSPG
jgi:hypothetical protein